MSQYPYNEQLKKPFLNIEYTQHNILTVPFIKWSNFYNHICCTFFKTKGGIKMRLLTVPVPDGAKIQMYMFEPEDLQEETPAIYHCHGGAFFLDIFPMILNTAAWFAEAGRCRVFVPRYRTSLEHPFPTPLEDCYNLWLHVAGHTKEYKVDPRKLMLYGDSDGGCLAAMAAQMSRDCHGPRACGQTLIYPVTDCEGDYSSRTEFACGTWSARSNEYMWKIYLRNTAKSQAVYRFPAPMRCDTCEDLPPAYVEPAEMDALRDEGIAYAKRLKRAGVPVQMHITPGAYHGFDGDLQNQYVQGWLKKRLEFIQACWDGSI